MAQKNREHVNASNRARAVALAAAGICIGCGQRPVVGTGKQCQPCMDEHNADYWQAVEAGVCTACRREDAAPGKRMCAGCALKMTTRNKARAAAKTARGRCNICGKAPPRPDRVTCLRCAGRRHRRYVIRKESRNGTGPDAV